jgi:hypothetical protein
MAGTSTCRSIRRTGYGRAVVAGQQFENNLVRPERSACSGVVHPTPGGVPPSPQPLTHPAKDPGPHRAPGSSFLWGAVAEALKIVKARGTLGRVQRLKILARFTKVGLASAPGWRTRPLGRNPAHFFLLLADLRLAAARLGANGTAVQAQNASYCSAGRLVETDIN